MTCAAAIPCPPATGRIGWTLYERHTGRVLGWVRRSEDCDPCYGRPPGTYFTIPREGPGDPAVYFNVRHAAQSPFIGVT